MTGRIAFLGPAGTYTEEAALAYNQDAQLVPCASIPAVASAVESGEADEGVVPIENSLEGAVTYTLDVLIHDSPLWIRNEVVLSIHNCLVARQGTRIGDIQVVYSHPQALAQCRGYIQEHLPGARVMASLSTAAAVEEMQQSEAVSGAISSHRAAELYGAEVLARNIEDNSNNQTRFVVLAKADHPPTGHDKTSICFAFEHDTPGILFTVLSEIASRGINLNKIESRPTRKVLGRYIFLLDIDGHREDPQLKEALKAIESQVSMLRVFGSYPRQVSSYESIAIDSD